MKNFKVNSFIKKIFAIVLSLMLVSTPISVFARAQVHARWTSSVFYSRYGYYHRGTLWGRLVMLAIVILVCTLGPIVVRKYNIQKKKIKADLTLCRLSESDNNWDYEEIKRDVEDAFYRFKVAWAEREMDMARDYMSRRLYDSHKMKTELMRQRKEKNILEDVTLLDAKPIGLEDNPGTDSDCIWVYIKAKMIDYTINEETNYLVEGKSDEYTEFEEYWKFIRVDDRWVADEIRQIDEVYGMNFFKVKV